MSQDIDAIYDHGVFRPVEPLVLPAGTKAHVRIETVAGDSVHVRTTSKIMSPRLADPAQAADFEMQVRRS
jgi:predicted DNA-binding antitoxin AbrB/MazE fold protein